MVFPQDNVAKYIETGKHLHARQDLTLEGARFRATLNEAVEMDWVTSVEQLYANVRDATGLVVVNCA